MWSAHKGLHLLFDSVTASQLHNLSKHPYSQVFHILSCALFVMWELPTAVSNGPFIWPKLRAVYHTSSHYWSGTKTQTRPFLHHCALSLLAVAHLQRVVSKVVTSDKKWGIPNTFIHSFIPKEYTVASKA